jgi:hypothetical protein
MEQMRALQRRIEQLEEEVKHTEFRASVAEWAVRGIVAYQARIHVTPQMMMDTKHTMKMIEVFGQQCAHSLLHQAGLEFKKHAEFYELRAKTLPRFDIDPDRIPDKEHWPK